MHPLDSCRLKLARAYEHSESLTNEVAALGKRHPYGLMGEFDANASEYVFMHRVYEPVPLRFSLILGDAVHNINSALDHLAWQLVRHNQREPIDGQTGFPIFDSRGKWEHQGRAER